LIWLLGHTRTRISHDWVPRLRVLGVVLSGAGVYALGDVAHVLWAETNGAPAMSRGAVSSSRRGPRRGRRYCALSRG